MEEISQERLLHFVPDWPWQKLNVDIFNYKGRDYLLAFDYFTEDFEIIEIQDNHTTTVCNAIQNHFARQNIPDIIVTNRKSQFTSEAFWELVHRWRLKHCLVNQHSDPSDMSKLVQNAIKVLEISLPPKRTRERQKYTLVPTVRRFDSVEIIPRKSTATPIKNYQKLELSDDYVASIRRESYSTIRRPPTTIELNPKQNHSRQLPQEFFDEPSSALHAPYEIKVNENRLHQNGYELPPLPRDFEYSRCMPSSYGAYTPQLTPVQSDPANEQVIHLKISLDNRNTPTRIGSVETYPYETSQRGDYYYPNSRTHTPSLQSASSYRLPTYAIVN